MKHDDHVNLIRNGIRYPKGTWAEFGSGRGAFTLALAELLDREARIISIDKDGAALEVQRGAFERYSKRQLAPRVEFRLGDYTKFIDLPELDGMLMANTLHFHRHKLHVLKRVYDILRPEGVLILVEYNTDKSNPWVPYPLSFATWKVLAGEAGFVQTSLLGRQPSSFMKEFYAAQSLKKNEI